MSTTITIAWGSNSTGPVPPGFPSAAGFFTNATGGGVGGSITGPTSEIGAYSVVAICESLSIPTIIVQGTAPQTLFGTVSYTDLDSNPHTLNSADATFSTSLASGFSIWQWPAVTQDTAPNGDIVFSSPLPTIVQATPTVVSSTDVILSWTATPGSDIYAGEFESFSILRNSQVLFDDIDPSVTEWADPTGLPSTTYTYEIQGQYSVGSVSPVISNDETITTGDMTDEFNCACASVTVYQTLAELRQRIFIDLGYPNQASNPPPGMASFINSKLYGAQKIIYKMLKNHGIDTERFFRWTMTPGLRYYALNASEGECTKTLDPLKVTWVGFEDLNQAWYRLTAGIPPEFYTRANINFGWPTHYEIRQCLEIFPAPQAPYTLWVKGHFGLASFTADGDTATIDDEAVFLLALGNCKMHYGQADAGSVLKQAATYIGGMVAGQHGTNRYVPRTKIQNPATPPRFLPLGGGQA